MGFPGGISKSPGLFAPYFATSTLEAIFHVATRIQIKTEEEKHKKVSYLDFNILIEIPVFMILAWSSDSNINYNHYDKNICIQQLRHSKFLPSSHNPYKMTTILI